MFDFGLRLRELRENRKMSQEELGSRIGRSKPVISSYENNLKVPPLDVLTNIAAVFNVSLDYLVGFDKKEMVSVDGLSEQQKNIIYLIVKEFREPAPPNLGLSERQQKILNQLLIEFAKKNR